MQSIPKLGKACRPSEANYGMLLGTADGGSACASPPSGLTMDMNVVESVVSHSVPLSVPGNQSSELGVQMPTIVKWKKPKSAQLLQSQPTNALHVTRSVLCQPLASNDFRIQLGQEPLL